MTAIGDSKTPVFVGNNGDATPCTKKLHSVTVQDLGDPDGPLLAYVYIDKVPYPIHDKKTQPVELPVTVQFKDWNGTILSTKTVEKGTEYSSITKPADPSREGYTFTGWGDPTPSTSIQDGKVVADCDVVAQYSIITCEVTFSDWDSRVIEKKTVNWGTNYSSITKPDDPSRTGYTFTGWSEPDPATAVVDDKVIGNCVIQAQYMEITKVTGYFSQSGSRASSIYDQTTINVPLKAGNRYRITIDDIHWCCGNYAQAYVGIDLKLSAGTESLTNDHIRHSFNGTAPGWGGTLVQDHRVWPNTNGEYYPGFETYWTTDVYIGEERESVGGSSFVSETVNSVSTDTTLSLTLNPIIQTTIYNNHDILNVNCRYTVEVIS